MNRFETRRGGFLARAALAVVCALGCGLTASAAANDKIAFTRGGGVWTMNGDGTGQAQVGSPYVIAINPSWSPDGTKLVFVCGGEPVDICTMNADGTNLKALTDTRNNGNPAWSPDGQKIAFTSSRDGGTHIFTMNPDGTNVQRLQINDPSVTSEADGAWSPDGSHLAFVGGTADDTEIYTVNVATGDAVRVTTMDVLVASPAYSPDGTRIAFDTLHAVHVVPAGGGAAALLASAGTYNLTPAWSPDGTRIAFHRYTVIRDENNNVVERRHDIYAMNADGTGETNLNAVGGSAPAYRPAVQAPPPPPSQTPAERIGELAQLVRSFKLPFGTTNSLTVKLKAAGDALDAGDTALACSRLADFVNHTNAQAGKKLAAAQAAQLVDEANSIRAALGCQ